MKKKIVFLTLLTTILLPISTLAQTCTNQIISGDASSQAANGSAPVGCDDDVCSSTVCYYDGSRCEYVGIRFQIYKYDPSKGKNGITKYGTGVDVWGTNELISNNYYFTTPVNNNLKIKSSCTEGVNSFSKNNEYYSDLYDVYTLNGSQYIKGKFDNKGYSVVYDKNVGISYSKGTMNDYILGSNYKSGWIYNNILNVLGKDDDTIKKLFYLTNKEVNELKSNPQSFYVTAEVLYRFTLRQSGTYFLGTVSEAARYHGIKDAYVALRSTGTPIGNMINNTDKYNDLIEQVDNVTYIEQFMNRNTFDSGAKNYYAGCNKAYGYAVYHLETVCEGTCELRSCPTACSAYSEGTLERNICAKSYCDLNPGEENCIESCVKNIEDSGCDKTYNNKCSKYVTETDDKGNNIYSMKDSYNYVCTSDEYQNSEEMSTRICYDDDKKYTSTEDYDKPTENRVLTNIKYYKIECKETLNLLNLPEKTYVKINAGGSSSFFTGYTMQYEKECKLYYKKEDKTSWTQKYSESLLKSDIEKYKNPACSKKLTKEECTKYKNLVDQAYKELTSVKQIAEYNLKKVTIADYKDEDTGAENSVSITSWTNNVTETIKLKPIYCNNYIDSATTSSEKKVNYCVIGEANSLVSTNCEYEPEVTDVKIYNGTAKWTEIIHYGLPSSWVPKFPYNSNSAYRDKEACLQAVNQKNNDDACREIKNAWVFDYASKEVQMEIQKHKNLNENYVLNIENHGSCGQFNYNLECQYDYSVDDNCAVCSDKSGSEYDECYERYCGCESYCGSNVACQAMYCPEECEWCGKQDSDEYEDCETPKCEEDCQKEDTKELQTRCHHDDCCVANCGGVQSCINSCCESGCNRYYGKGTTAAATCIQKYCPSIITQGDEFVYRTINPNNPFPERDPGHNWYGKINYITQKGVIPTDYKYDKTNGDSESYEYRIKLTSEQITDLKSDKTLNDYKIEGVNSKKAKRTKGERVYCSYFIHEYLSKKNIEVKSLNSEKSDNILGSGCYIE